MSQPLVVTRIEERGDAGRVARVTVDNVERRNALGRRGKEELIAAFTTLARRVRDEQRLDDTFVDHFRERMTFGGAIVHVVLHDTEHRSEALHILERLGVPDLPEVDHGLWDLAARGT